MRPQRDEQEAGLCLAQGVCGSSCIPGPQGAISVLPIQAHHSQNAPLPGSSILSTAP